MSVEDSGGASWLGEPVPLPPVGVDVAEVRARARRRTRTTRAVLGAGAVAVIVAGGSVIAGVTQRHPGGWGPGRGEPETVGVARPPDCPATLAPAGDAPATTSPATTSPATTGPFVAVAEGLGRACRYAGMNDRRPWGALVASAVLSTDDVSGLARLLRAVPPGLQPTPGSELVIHCPIDDGAAALLLLPAAGGWQRVRVELGGCSVVEAPSGRRAWGFDLESRVRAWTGAGPR